MSQRMFGLLAVFVLMLLLTGNAQAQVQSPDDSSRLRTPITTLPVWEENSGQGMGAMIAGSWSGSGSFSLDFDCDGAADTGPVGFVTDAHTFDVGGSHVTTNPANPNSGHGTWVKTGPRQITVRDLNFGVDSTPNGNLTSKAIITMVVEFDRYYETAATSFGAKVYDPADNPLDPDAVPFICTVGQHDSLKRVSATD